jgi:anti-sigma factor RsiW
MTCREFIEFVWRYVEEGLRPEERAQFEAHLADCPDCVKYLQSYRETMRAGRIVFRDFDESVPADVPEELIQAILASRACSA